MNTAPEGRGITGVVWGAWRSEAASTAAAEGPLIR
jgi:hypothetical protein